MVSAGIALSPLIVLAFGSDPAETAILTRIMFPFLALVSVAALFQGILNAYGVFKPSGVAPVLFNICFMGVPLLAGGSFANPARAMAVGVLLGGTAQAFCQLAAVLRTGHRFGLVPLARAFRNSGMGKVLGLIAPTVVGMAAYQINDIVSTILASRAGTGIAASLQYSLRLQELMLGIFAVSASTVLLPELADASRQEDWARFLSRPRTGMEGIILATVPVAIFSMITGREIVSLLFRMREFGDESVNLTVSVFFWHQAGLAFIALNRVVAPAFYARSDTKTPTMAGIVSFGVNMALALVLAPVLRGSGIAMALSIAGIVNTALLLHHVRSSAIPGSVRMLRAFAGTACRVLLVSAGAGLPLLVMRPAILELGAGSGSRWISAGMPLALQSILYGCMVVAIAHVSGVASIGRVLTLFRRR